MGAKYSCLETTNKEKVLIIDAIPELYNHIPEVTSLAEVNFQIKEETTITLMSPEK